MLQKLFAFQTRDSHANLELNLKVQLLLLFYNICMFWLLCKLQKLQSKVLQDVLPL